MSANEYDLGAPPAPQALNPNEGRELAESMAASGISTEIIAEHLKARGLDPEKVVAPADAARYELQQLKGDPAFAAALERGDADALAKFNALTFKMSMGKQFSPVPETAKPEDYRFNLQRVSDNEIAGRMQSETAAWASELKLPTNIAASIMENMIDNVERTAGYGQDARVNDGEAQLALLKSVVGRDGTDPDKALKDAASIIKRHSGKSIDIAVVARTNGVKVAHELVLHAVALNFAESPPWPTQ